jgi:hypothetical protein
MARATIIATIAKDMVLSTPITSLTRFEYPDKNVPHVFNQTDGVCENKHTDEAHREGAHERTGFRPVRKVDGYRSDQKNRRDDRK